MSHADMRETDHCPTEEGEEGGEVRQPSKDFGTTIADVDVRETTADDESRYQTIPWTAPAVSLLEYLDCMS